MLEVLAVLIMIVACLGLMIVITTFLTKRAMGQVLRILKFHQATSEEGAKSIAEMGLNPPTFRERLMKMRDYKPKALDFLVNLGIVQSTADGRIFLSEEKLLSSDLVKRWPSLARRVQPK